MSSFGHPISLLKDRRRISFISFLLVRNWSLYYVGYNVYWLLCNDWCDTALTCNLAYYWLILYLRESIVGRHDCNPYFTKLRSHWCRHWRITLKFCLLLLLCTFFTDMPHTLWVRFRCRLHSQITSTVSPRNSRGFLDIPQRTELKAFLKLGLAMFKNQQK